MKVNVDIQSARQVVVLAKQRALLVGGEPTVIELTFADWLKATAAILLVLAGEALPRDNGTQPT